MTEEKTVMVSMLGDRAGLLAGIEGAVAGREYPLSAGTFVIGRDESADLSLPNEPGMSRLHAKIVAEGDRYRILDIESRNGTLVNGRPIQSEFLFDGDTVRIGSCVLRFSQRVGVQRPPPAVRTPVVAAPLPTAAPAPVVRPWLAAAAGAVLIALVLTAVVIGIFIGRDPNDGQAATTDTRSGADAGVLAADPSALADAGAVIALVDGAGAPLGPMTAAPATLVAAQEVPLRLSKGGKVASVAAKDGDAVDQGTVIAIVIGSAASAADIATRKESISALESVAESSPRAAAQLAIEKKELATILGSTGPTKVTAPAAGKIAGLLLLAGEVVRTRQVVARIVTKPASVTVEVSAAVAAALPMGVGCTLTRADGTTLPGTLAEKSVLSAAIALQIDPVGDATGVATAVCGP